MLFSALFAAVQVLLALGVFRSMWFSLLRWRIDLYGQVRLHRVRDISIHRVDQGPEVRRTVLYRYVFAIRNAEADVLNVPLACEIALEKAGTRFLDGPVLVCGFASRFAGQ